MEKARQLFRKTSCSVPRIAFGVGYKSVSQFFEIFRRHTGAPPLDYRRYA